MIFAIPYARSALSAHFSKAPRWMIINDETGEKVLLSLPESTSSCGNKKHILALFKRYKVEAVIARSIGTNMLQALFNNQIDVYSANKRTDFDALHPANLTRVTELSYGKLPPNAKKCGKKSSCCNASHHHSSQTSLVMSPQGKMTVMALSHSPIRALRAFK